MLTLPYTVQSLSALVAFIKSPKKKKPGFLSSGRRTASYPSGPSVSDPLELEYSEERSTSGNYSRITSEKGAISGLCRVLLEECRQGLWGLATSCGRAATQWWNLVREVALCLIANWDSAWRNHTLGESMQKVGNLMETVVRKTWPSGRKGTSSCMDTATVAKKEKECLYCWKSYYCIWVWKEQWPGRKQFPIF